jgi:hypothetical protein
MMTIMTHAVASSTNTMTLPERRSRNRVRVHATTRKKEVLDQSKQMEVEKIARHVHRILL